MTTRLYFTSDALEAKANVISCQEQDGQYYVTLDASIFHPQGGGQISDIGYIGSATVKHVSIVEDQLRHQVDQAIPLGEVELKVDAATRLLSSRLHSAGHLIGNVGLALGISPIKAHHWPNEAKVTFKNKNAIATPENVLIERELALLIEQDLPRNISEQGGVRMLQFGKLPGFPCGGTHVARLSEIGKIDITSIKSKKDEIIIHYQVRNI